MRNPLSKTIEQIKPSGIRKFFDIVSEMPHAISLGVGEPDFDTPWHVRSEGIRSLEKGRTFYTSNSGLIELRQEICKWYQRKYNVLYDYKTEALLTVGGSEGIDVALRAMLDPGDEVIIPEPCYVSYVPCVQLIGAVPVTIELKNENQFRLTSEELLAAITDKTKILILAFPSNPTGAVMTKEDLEPIAKICQEKDIYVISDEILFRTYIWRSEALFDFIPAGHEGADNRYQRFLQGICDDRMETWLCACPGGNRTSDDEDPSVCNYVCTDHEPVCSYRSNQKWRCRYREDVQVV